MGLIWLSVSGPWESQGPTAISGGQVENLAGSFVAGAVNALAPHPTDPQVLFIGSVNGGIWRSSSATATVPQWQPLTDDQPSLSIGSLNFDPSDGAHLTLVASVARSSAFNTEGGSRSGLLRSVDGGDSWTLLDALAGRNLVAVEARGDQLVAASNGGDTGGCEDLGLFVSSNTGQSFQRVVNGIPGGVIDALARDPGNPDVLYAAVILGGLCTSGGLNGIYRSGDFGLSWEKISPGANALALDRLLEDLPGTHVEMAVGPTGTLYVAVVPGTSGQLEGVFFTPDGGTRWVAMDLPGSFEPQFQGIHPSRQGFVHLSLVADPLNENLIYVGGDRQPQSDLGQFPNAIGAMDFSGRLFRGDITQPDGFQWAPITHAGTFAGSAPHADSRELDFDAAGQLLDANDGGVYRQSSSASFFGDWFSVNGNLQITETHSGSLDPSSGVVLGGNQDTGSTEQSAPGSLEWISVNTGDGGDVAVADLGGRSLRYHSFGFFARATRSLHSADNVLESRMMLALAPIDDSPALQAQFLTPLAVNIADPNSLAIGGANGLFLSQDQGDTVQQVLADVAVNGLLGNSLIYGWPGRPQAIAVAGCSPLCDGSSTGQIWQRGSLEEEFSVVFTGSDSIGIPAITRGPGSSSLFVLERTRVLGLLPSGQTVNELTGNLLDLNPGRLRSLLWLGDEFDSGLLVGADRGVFVAFESGGYLRWIPLDDSLPNAPVLDLDYVEAQGRVLATTLGRGSFVLTGFPQRLPRLFVSGFE